MSKVFHRSNKPLQRAVSGKGLWITDSEGREYLDASSGGVGLTAIGYSHPKVVEAITRQASTLPFIHSTVFTTEPLEALAEELVNNAPKGLTRASFTSGGSEAVEVAIMIAKQCAVAMGQPDRNIVITRRKSYHGGTTMTLGIADHAPRKRAIQGILPDTIRISAAYEYREKHVGETPEQYGLRIANELETAIQSAGPDKILGFIAETVGGGGYGALTPPPGYFKRIREICDQYGILLILDEVYCGLGRSGTLYAFEADGILPDICVVAKGLAAGFAPIGSVLVTDQVYDTIVNGMGGFSGGYTHSGHSLSCAAALAVQQVIREERLVENAATQGQLLRQTLEERFGNHRHVGDIRGRGLIQGIELVADRGSKEPFDPERKLAPQISQAARDHGLICLVASGTVDDVRGEHIMLAPPLIVTPAEVHEIVGRLADALADILPA